jgi:hypothetical protein
VAGRVAPSFAARCGDAPHSLLAIHPFCLYARLTPVFQQSPKACGCRREAAESSLDIWPSPSILHGMRTILRGMRKLCRT